MSRIIKFRAWDSDMKFMINPYCELKDGRFWGEDCTNNPFSIDQENVMQYTGIKDKKGKEIYEGDVIKSDRGTVFKIKWHQNESRWSVVQVNGNLTLELMYDAFSLFEEMSPEIEVIGNIYEHPHLLKESIKH